MSWFADLAGKAESLLNNLDEQTGAALRSHNVLKKRHECGIINDYGSSVPPDGAWARKRPVSRNSRKNMPIPDTKSIYSPSRRSSPTHHQPRSPVKDPHHDTSRPGSVKSKKSPSRKNSPHGHQPYNLNHCPKTLVGDVKDNNTEIIVDHFGIKHRRLSLPTDLEIVHGEDWTYKMQNLEVENAMLKNELNVMNREVAELLDRLRRTEDGKNVDSSEATKARIRLESSDVLNHRMTLEQQSLTNQLELLKAKIQDNINAELAKYNEQKTVMEAELNDLRSKNKEMEQKCEELTDQVKEKETAQIKLENDMKHAQTTINELQGNLDKTTEECRRLEKDWEAYKVRVKNMLLAKDTEIKALQEGLSGTEDTKVLLEQIENLKEERDDMSEAVAVVRSECSDMKAYLHQVEARHNAAERAVAALRDALREERAARNRADAQSLAVAKEMKSLQMESAQTIANLRNALREKENELHHLHETASTVRTTDTSALNVADYDMMQDTIESNKLNHLTQTLVQRQGKIDNLLAENNTLKIQLEKLENKYKSELQSLRSSNTHSVVHFQDCDSRNRIRAYPINTLSALSLRLGVTVKRYPIIRVFVIAYMVCLHFWVLYVLFKSTPEDFMPAATS